MTTKQIFGAGFIAGALCSAIVMLLLDPPLWTLSITLP